MKKLLKLSMGITGCVILILYLIFPLVIVNKESYSFFRYLKYILNNITLTFKTPGFNQIDMLYNVIVWLGMLVLMIVPLICLLIIAIKGLIGTWKNKKINIISPTIISFVFSMLIIGLGYYLLNIYTLPGTANQLQIAIVKISCNHIWQPLLYISTFGSLLMLGINIYTNAVEK